MDILMCKRCPWRQLVYMKVIGDYNSIKKNSFPLHIPSDGEFDGLSIVPIFTSIWGILASIEQLQEKPCYMSSRKILSWIINENSHKLPSMIKKSYCWRDMLQKNVRARTSFSSRLSLLYTKWHAPFLKFLRTLIWMESITK